MPPIESVIKGDAVVCLQYLHNNKLRFLARKLVGRAIIIPGNGICNTAKKNWQFPPVNFFIYSKDTRTFIDIFNNKKTANCVSRE